MDFSTLLQKAFVEGFSNAELTIPAMMLSIVIAALLAIYEFYIYRIVNRNMFYSRNYNLSLIETGQAAVYGTAKELDMIE